MKRRFSFRALARKSGSRLSSLLLLFQKSPIVQFFIPEAKMLGVAGTGEMMKWAVAAVVGLETYDTVSGASGVSQVSPVPNSTTVPATAGQQLNFVVQVTGTESAAKSWQVTGTIPPGLVHSNTVNTVYDSFVGVPTQAGTYSVTIRAWEDPGFRGNSLARTFSIVVAPGAPTPPAITTSPVSVTIDSGQTTTLNVAASGTAPTFQWYIGNAGDTSSPVSGATATSFTTPALTATTTYWVRASNTAGTADSTAAVVTVISPPQITTQPLGTSVTSGSTASLSVVAVGTNPGYQWFEGASGDTSNPVPGATTANFTTPAINAGKSYWVRVSNSAGSVDSNAALVAVVDNFASWAAGRFSPAQLADPLISGEAADPDGDGLSNGAEYVFGTDPLVSQVSPAPVIATTGGQVALEFVAVEATGPGYAGATRHYALESATSLSSGNWTAVSGQADIIASGQTVSVNEAPGATPKFFRVKAWLTH